MEGGAHEHFLDVQLCKISVDPGLWVKFGFFQCQIAQVPLSLFDPSCLQKIQTRASLVHQLNLPFQDKRQYDCGKLPINGPVCCPFSSLFLSYSYCSVFSGPILPKRLLWSQDHGFLFLGTVSCIVCLLLLSFLSLSMISYLCLPNSSKERQKAQIYGQFFTPIIWIDGQKISQNRGLSSLLLFSFLLFIFCWY